MSEREQCCQKIRGDGWGVKPQCSRAAVIERDGRHYCKQHDPLAVAVREAKGRAKWNADMDRWTRERLARQFIADIPTATLEVLVNQGKTLAGLLGKTGWRDPEALCASCGKRQATNSTGLCGWCDGTQGNSE
jgi:hypothetical protein